MPAEPRARRSALLIAGTLAAAAAAIVTTLMIPPIVGLADNGDFDRVMLPAGLRSLAGTFEDRYFRWMQPRFAHAAPTADVSGYRSSEIPLARAAAAASRLTGASLFDIRFLGAIHASLLLLALALLVAAGRDLLAPAQALAAALLVFFFTDPGYIAAFQSLYPQAASLPFLLLTAGVAALAIRSGRLTGAALPAYFLCAALFVTSKPQESVQALLLAPLGIRLAWPGSGRFSRAAALLLAAAVGILAWGYYRSSQASSGWLTRYNQLFFEILPNSPDPARDLEELGLDPALARFVRVNAWAPESPARLPAVREFLEPRSGRTSPRMLYLRHPGRALDAVRRASRASFRLQAPELGQFAKESGAPPLARAHGIWSDRREGLSGLSVLFALLGGTLGAAAATYRRTPARGRLFREALVVLVAMAAGAFLTAALGDWHNDLERHLYAFHAMCDLILVADAAWLTQALVSWRMRRGAHGAPHAPRLGRGAHGTTRDPRLAPRAD